MIFTIPSFESFGFDFVSKEIHSTFHRFRCLYTDIDIDIALFYQYVSTPVQNRLPFLVRSAWSCSKFLQARKQTKAMKAPWQNDTSFQKSTWRTLQFSIDLKNAHKKSKVCFVVTHTVQSVRIQWSLMMF